MQNVCHMFSYEIPLQSLVNNDLHGIKLPVEFSMLTIIVVGKSM